MEAGKFNFTTNALKTYHLSHNCLHSSTKLKHDAIWCLI